MSPGKLHSGPFTVVLAVMTFLAFDATTQPAAVAADSGQQLDTRVMAAMMPEDWDIVDDSERMSMVTLTKKGGSGQVGIYFKVEGSGNWAGTPLEATISFAEQKGGSAPETVTLNEIEWVSTSYGAFGSDQTMMVTKKDGNKVTVTLLGGDYSASPATEMFLDSLVLK